MNTPLRKAKGITLINKNKTHCLRGHLFDEVNTYRSPKGYRACRKCMSVHTAKYHQAHKKEQKATNVESKNRLRFGGNREKAILRDGEKCVRCGMTRQQHKAKHKVDLNVHHIDGRGVNSDNPNNTLENMETLCWPCHGREEWMRYNRPDQVKSILKGGTE
jgi:5-methylcytosine-specific restriction endonuclease McrA